MAIKRKGKSHKGNNKRIVRRKVVKRIEENLTDEQLKEIKADKILPRKPDLFITKNAVYPPHILTKNYRDLTSYEQKLYFEPDGTLRPTTEYGHPRDRTLARYNQGTNSDLSNPNLQIKNVAKGERLPGAGRHKGSFSLTAILKALCKKASKYDHNKTVARSLMEVMIDKSLKGDFSFMRELMNRMEGKVPDRLNINDPSSSAREAQSILEQLQEENVA